MEFFFSHIHADYVDRYFTIHATIHRHTHTDNMLTVDNSKSLFSIYSEIDSRTAVSTSAGTKSTLPNDSL